MTWKCIIPKPNHIVIPFPFCPSCLSYLSSLFWTALKGDPQGPLSMFALQLAFALAASQTQPPALPARLACECSFSPPPWLYNRRYSICFTWWESGHRHQAELYRGEGTSKQCSSVQSIWCNTFQSSTLNKTEDCVTNRTHSNFFEFTSYEGIHQNKNFLHGLFGILTWIPFWFVRVKWVNYVFWIRVGIVNKRVNFLGRSYVSQAHIFQSNFAPRYGWALV